ncbi:sodium-driven chloride bicarbonate exchanger-like, partial [Leptonychotes weddellii]|uniref:Sodium-driven chloride bicarbonate exchanger-like n=1 Tax=Leptonychotes weddellii TaxID=9713 RepID=A0A7F8QD08_LEPWE
WLKFEEDVEDGGERWSKPYVATLSLHSLFELRSCILNGTVLLDMHANTLEEIAAITQWNATSFIEWANSHGNACSCLSLSIDTPSQRVQFILGTEDDDEEHIPHDLFTELDEICWREGEDAEWRETARWLKFEEDVEDGGERWSKPYVATLSLHSLFELRSCILNGTVLLDMHANTLEEIA